MRPFKPRRYLPRIPFELDRNVTYDESVTSTRKAPGDIQRLAAGAFSDRWSEVVHSLPNTSPEDRNIAIPLAASHTLTLVHGHETIQAAHTYDVNRGREPGYSSGTAYRDIARMLLRRKNLVKFSQPVEVGAFAMSRVVIREEDSHFIMSLHPRGDNDPGVQELTAQRQAALEHIGEFVSSRSFADTALDNEDLDISLPLARIPVSVGRMFYDDPWKLPLWLGQHIHDRFEETEASGRRLADLTVGEVRLPEPPLPPLLGENS